MSTNYISRKEGEACFTHSLVLIGTRIWLDTSHIIIGARAICGEQGEAVRFHWVHDLGLRV